MAVYQQDLAEEMNESHTEDQGIVLVPSGMSVCLSVRLFKKLRTDFGEFLEGCDRARTNLLVFRDDPDDYSDSVFLENPDHNPDPGIFSRILYLLLRFP